MISCNEIMEATFQLYLCSGCFFGHSSLLPFDGRDVTVGSAATVTDSKVIRLAVRHGEGSLLYVSD